MAWSQSQLNNNSLRLETIKKITNQIDDSRIDLSEINGSPYLETQFHLGNVERNNVTETAQLYLRYNGYNDEIEIGRRQDQPSSKTALLKEKDIRATFNNRVYQYISFNDKKGDSIDGYLVSIYNAKNYNLFLRNSKILVSGKKARTSLEKDIPPRFKKITSYYISSKENTTPQEISLKLKDILPLLIKEDQSKVKQLKTDFKKIKSHKDLIQLFKHLDM